MLSKIRQLIGDLEKHGFIDRGGKGSHRNFLHPRVVKITLSGAPGDDAKHYQKTRPQTCDSKGATMGKSKPSDHYVKLVAWSDEDQCYVGRCPGLMLGGVHGSDEREVYAELCEAVDEWIRLHQAEGLPLPRPTSLRKIEALV